MNADTSQFFLNADLLIQLVGEWPSFHDAEILRFEMCRRNPPVAVLMDVYVFRRYSEADAEGRYVLKNPSVVTLFFRDVEDLELSGWNEQNVVSGLPVSRRPDGRLLVEIEDLYGLGGSFTCSEAQVKEVRSADFDLTADGTRGCRGAPRTGAVAAPQEEGGT